ncbi:Caffeic acid 3-O-methyltransferase [Heracleum sosnowskyi]|uniref:Caffeic acid 3-O-methyltransferase n=1 Tax=Heracleum sosnowskyi TaxID=360622 RepID=A0AAD8HT06_9APIA|nr:Caffeic acid 3-O-methyltransferase [Heracleum sosnowskyi]
MGSHDEEGFLEAMALMSAGTVQRVLTTLCELKVFDIIMQKVGLHGYVSPDEIASNLDAKNPDASSMLDRMLCLLASHSIVKWKLEKSTRSYGLTSISKYYVRDQSGNSVAPLHLFCYHEEIQSSWYRLKDAVLEGGISFNKSHKGLNFFEYLEKNKGLADLLSESMAKSIAPSMTLLLEKYNGFEGVKEVVDVGGAFGATLSSIVSNYPNIKGINFDLPHVVQNAPALPGVTHVGGDVFESVPSGDVILLQRVLHDWDDEGSVKILKKCHEALPYSGKVVIMEMILAELTGNEDIVAKNTFQMDVGMMLQFKGGKERSAKEFEKLAIEAGFQGTALVCVEGLYGVVECYKKM